MQILDKQKNSGFGDHNLHEIFKHNAIHPKRHILIKFYTAINKLAFRISQHQCRSGLISWISTDLWTKTNIYPTVNRDYKLYL